MPRSVDEGRYGRFYHTSSVLTVVESLATRLDSRGYEIALDYINGYEA